MKEDPTKNKEANDKYDVVFLEQLKLRLKRDPKPNEIINADNDSDLVNETLWQLVCDLYAQLQEIKDKLKMI